MERVTGGADAASYSCRTFDVGDIPRHETPRMGRLLKTPPVLIVVVVLWVWMPNRGCAQAAPPFLSNDPGTPGSGNWEINVASAQSISRGVATYQVPQIDLNFGLGDRIQLTYQVPYVIQTQTGQSHESGWSNAFPGVKWRFLDQGDGNFQASIFPQAETNGLASAQRKDIAVAGPRWLLPLEVTKRLGPLDVDLEAGFYLPKQDVHERILGLVLGQSLTERLDLAVELYNDHAFGAPPNQTTLDLGGRFKLARGFIALFMAGRSVSGTANGPEFIGYFGIQILLSDYGRALAREETSVGPEADR